MLLKVVDNRKASLWQLYDVFTLFMRLRVDFKLSTFYIIMTWIFTTSSKCLSSLAIKLGDIFWTINDTNEGYK